MNQHLRNDAECIARSAIEAVKPDEAVRRALKTVHLPGRIYMIAVGKAAWQMANAAVRYLKRPICKGVVITKYGHVGGTIPNVVCYEAGHPIPDENSYRATQTVLDMTRNLNETDTVLFLLSGGGSALFEKPLVDPCLLQSITQTLLRAGASITEINTIRKRLSSVKGGRFAIHCAPAKIEAIILSDILGDPLDMIASGPVTPDSTTSSEAKAIVKKYIGEIYEIVEPCLNCETPKNVANVHAQVVGSVRELCRAAEKTARILGYECIFLTDCLNGEASDTGRWMATEMMNYAHSGRKIALVAGGETVVHVKGNGLGGRNQELVLSAAELLSGNGNVALISVGSDGTDGPTDAAGGYVDGDTLRELLEKGIDINAHLGNNDAYNALKNVDALIITGPTGTNVNDVTIGLIDDSWSG